MCFLHNGFLCPRRLFLLCMTTRGLRAWCQHRTKPRATNISRPSIERTKNTNNNTITCQLSSPERHNFLALLPRSADPALRYSRHYCKYPLSPSVPTSQPFADISRLELHSQPTFISITTKFFLLFLLFPLLIQAAPSESSLYPADSSVRLKKNLIFGHPATEERIMNSALPPPPVPWYTHPKFNIIRRALTPTSTYSGVSTPSPEPIRKL